MHLSNDILMIDHRFVKEFYVFLTFVEPPSLGRIMPREIFLGYGLDLKLKTEGFLKKLQAGLCLWAVHQFAKSHKLIDFSKILQI